MLHIIPTLSFFIKWAIAILMTIKGLWLFKLRGIYEKNTRGEFAEWTIQR